MYKLILVKPENEGNLGFIARLMENFGFEDLVLVDPSFKIGETAKNRAVHAQETLEDLKIYQSYQKAIKNVDLLVGTTGIKTSNKNLLRKGISPEKMAKNVCKTSSDVGFVFGKESTGLSNEKLKDCDFVVKIPASPDYSVLNLSHAVGIILYEVFRHEEKVENKQSGIKREENGVLENLYKGILEKLGYSEKKKRQVYRSLENVFGRSFLHQEEAYKLIGFLKDVKNELNEKHQSKD